MTKILTVVEEIDHCGECCECDWEKGKSVCLKTHKNIGKIWGAIPKWCPLPEKLELGEPTYE